MPIPDPRPKGFTSTIIRNETLTAQYGAAVVPNDPPLGPWNLGPSMAFTSIRPDWTVSKVELIPGTSTPWRKPTTYTRFIRSYVNIDECDLRVRDGMINFHYVGPTTNADFRLNMVHAKDWQSDWVDFDVPPELKGRLITEALLKIKDQKVNIGENLATARQTYDLLADKTIPLAQALLAARRGNWAAAAQHLGVGKKNKHLIGKRSAGLWLEYQYGWKPLMSDIKGTYDLLMEQLNPALLVTGVRTFKDEFQDSYDNGRLFINRRFTRRASVHLTGKVSSQGISLAKRIGLTNPLSLGWELVPFSFVVDWAAPIGNTLSALDAAAGLDFIGGHYSLTHEGTWTGRRDRIFNNDPIADGTPGLAWERWHEFRREAFTSWPKPQFYGRSPFSTTRGLTALALLRQLF